MIRSNMCNVNTSDINETCSSYELQRHGTHRLSKHEHLWLASQRVSSKLSWLEVVELSIVFVMDLRTVEPEKNATTPTLKL